MTKKERKTKKANRLLLVLVVATAGLLAISLGLVWNRGGSEQATAPAIVRTPSVPASPPAGRKPPVPPYYASAEAAKPFPRLVPASRYRGYPLVQRAYQVAAEIPEVIAQQPCYCYCDKFGHASLLDCYASDHGAG